MGPGELGGRLTDDDVVRLSEQIAGLTRAGMPLAPGLRAAADEVPPGRLRRTLAAIADSVERGASLEEAVAEQGDRIPGHLKGLVLIGARTGNMSQVLGRFVAFVNVGAGLRRGLWVNLAYPAISLFAAFAVLTFVCSTLVSSFEAIFRDFGVPLPKLTILVIAVARLFNVGWGMFVEILIGFVVFAVVFRVVLGPATRRALLASIPLLGRVWRNSSLAEFCHLLGLLLESGVPLDQSLRLTADGVSDTSVDRASLGLAVDVGRGLTLSQAVARQRIFPRGLERVLRWAEGQQSLPQSLHMVGEMFEAQARAQSGFAGTVVGVFTVFFILFGVAIVVVSLFLPLITLISKLSG